MNKILVVIIFLGVYGLVVLYFSFKKKKKIKEEDKETTLQNDEGFNVKIEFKDNGKQLNLSNMADFVIGLEDLKKNEYKTVNEAIKGIKNKIASYIQLNDINFNNLINILKIKL